MREVTREAPTRDISVGRGGLPAGRYVLSLATTAVLALLAACGGGSTFNVQNPPPPPSSNVTIALQSTPPQSIPINTSLNLVANVDNDPTNAGVDWSLVCQSGVSCGTLTAAHTASGDSVTYNPPLTLTGNNASVKVVAYATASPSANTIASFSINAFGTVLNGNYVFHITGSDSNFQPFQMAGVITLDGTGDACSGFITAGQQTLNSLLLGPVISPIIGASGAPCAPNSYYFIGSDGRGTITLSLLDPADSSTPITETFSLVVLSSSKALISAVNSTSSLGTVSGVGALELQDPVAATALPSGPYAFVAGGVDTTPLPIGYGGILNIDSSGNIFGTNSLLDETVLTNAGSGPGYNIIPCAPPFGPTGSVAWLDAMNPLGPVVFNLSTALTGLSCFDSGIAFAGYIVDASHIELIEIDGSFFTAGPAIAQTGSLSISSFDGPYAFSVLGVANPFNGVVPSSFASVGIICPDGAGGLDACTNSGVTASGGYTDTLFLSDNVALPGGVNSLCSFPPCPGQVSAEINGIGNTFHFFNLGRVSAPNLNLIPQPVPAHPFEPIMNFYLTGSAGSPALVLMTGGNNVNYPAVGTGIAYAQQQPSTALSFGDGELYGVNFVEQSGSEVDGSGQLTSTLNQGTPGGTFAGSVDDSLGGIGSPFNSAFGCLAGEASCPDSFGRFDSGTFVDGIAGVFYMIDPNNAFFVETDLLSNFVNGGTLQTSLATIAQRCDVTVTDPANPTYCQPPAAAAAQRRALTSKRRSPGIRRKK